MKKRKNHISPMEVILWKRHFCRESCFHIKDYLGNNIIAYIATEEMLLILTKSGHYI